MIFRHNIYQDIKDCGPEYEPFIIEASRYSPKYGYYYAKDKLRTRWSAIEEILVDDIHYGCLYAKNVIKGRWLEWEKRCEEKLHDNVVWNKDDNDWFAFYAKNVKKSTWQELESKIISSTKINEYKSLLKTEEDKKRYERMILATGIRDKDNVHIKSALSWAPNKRLKYPRVDVEVISNFYKVAKIEPKDEFYIDLLNKTHTSYWNHHNTTELPIIVFTPCLEEEADIVSCKTQKEYLEGKNDSALDSFELLSGQQTKTLAKYYYRMKKEEESYSHQDILKIVEKHITSHVRDGHYSNFSDYWGSASKGFPERVVFQGKLFVRRKHLDRNFELVDTD